MVIHLPLALLHPLLSILLSLLFSPTSANYYLKLPLLHNTDQFPPNPSQSLSSDLHRLDTLLRRKSPQLPLTSGASTGSGQYFVDLRIGTPPQRLLLVADTGSDLVWVSCSACRDCSNHTRNSAFFPRHSSTFSPQHCYDDSCLLVPHPRHAACNNTRLHSPCRYEYSYSDGSFTSGFFSRETTTFNTSSGNAVKHNKLAFGCGFDLSKCYTWFIGMRARSCSRSNVVTGVGGGGGGWVGVYIYTHIYDCVCLCVYWRE